MWQFCGKLVNRLPLCFRHPNRIFLSNGKHPALKVVHFNRSGHFGRSDRNAPFHLTKLLFPVTLFCILLTRTITRRAVARVGSVQPECTVPLGTWNFRNFKPEFLLNGKRPRRQASEAQRQKGRQRSRARDKNKGDIFLFEEQHEDFVAAVTK